MSAGADTMASDDPEPGSANADDSADIDIAVLDPQWTGAISDLDAVCSRAARAAGGVLGQVQSADLSVAFMDDAQIRTLNLQFRGQDKPTNVLSFLPDGHNPVMGDIALAYETCVREAADKNISLSDHITHLIVHGYLHLSGYDHQTDSEASAMEALEITALKTLKIENPYEDHNV